jgi:2-C-methyl-D-erythritol 4-phosphate cytidylyltransferase/2-C-methyl-D-erythritol 2,4-cyclodiphosphate synthase
MNNHKKTAVIIAAAGSGTRMGGGILKQYIDIGGVPLAIRASRAFLQHEDIDCLVYVAEEGAGVSRGVFGFSGKDVRICTGGPRRQDSVQSGLRCLDDDVELVLVHDGARPFVDSGVIRRVLDGLTLADAVIPCVQPISTIRTKGKTLDRSALYEVQTPQGFRKPVLEQGFAQAQEQSLTVTDEASLMELLGVEVHIVEGSRANIKVTTREDLPMKMRSGIGFDAHRLVAGRELWLGCVRIPFEKGLQGHSDADVLAHAVADALLGAAALGDIGFHFPDSDERLFGLSGAELLTRTASILRDAGFTISSVDATLSCEQPKISPYRQEMCARMACALGIAEADVSVKATTQEGMGFVGAGEGLSAMAVAVVCEPDR